LGLHLLNAKLQPWNNVPAGDPHRCAIPHPSDKHLIVSPRRQLGHVIERKVVQRTGLENRDIVTQNPSHVWDHVGPWALPNGDRADTMGHSMGFPYMKDPPCPGRKRLRSERSG